MPLSIFNVLAVAGCFCASTLLYLTSPNQQWLPKPYWRFSVGVVAGAVVLGLSWWSFRQNLSVFSASFTVLFLALFCLGLMPLLSTRVMPIRVSRDKKRIEKSTPALWSKWNWWRVIVGSLVLGYVFALGASAVLIYLMPETDRVGDRTQLMMWLVTPIWLTCVSTAFFTRSIKRFFLTYSGAIVWVYFLLWLLTRTV